MTDTKPSDVSDLTDSVLMPSTSATKRLTLGAALKVKDLPHFADWLKDRQRDLEIQDGYDLALLDAGDWRGLAAEARRILDGHSGRRGIHAPYQNTHLGAFDPKYRAFVIDRYKQALDFCAEVGGTHMVCHSPMQFLGNPFVPSTLEITQHPLYQAVAATLDAVVPHAEKIGCALVIENIWDRLPWLWARIVRSYNSPFVRLSVDTGHAMITHLEGAPPVDHWLKEAGEWLAHVHIQDTDGYGDRHWAPGDGNLNWRAVFSVLSSLPQTPRLILELYDASEIGRGAAYLQRLGLAE